MSYARAIFLGLGLASACAGETFDLLPRNPTQGGDGGGAGDSPRAGSAGAAGKGGTAGKGGNAGTDSVPPPEGGSSGWPGECPSGNCFPFCEKDEDCGFGVCLLSRYSGRCVECLNEDHCPRDENCDRLTNSCMVACTPEDESDEANPDCPGSRPHCSASRNDVCVECVFEEHCTDAVDKHCSWDNRCVQCRFNRDCANPSPVCETNYDADFELYACRACHADYECGEERDCINGSCVKFEASPEP
jgi:hypothetical protein